MKAVSEKISSKRTKPVVLIIDGSHRKGNTYEMVKHFAKGARQGNAKAEIVRLKSLDFSPCCGWSDCFYKNYCIIKDSFLPLHKKMLSADALCFASPNYFNNVSGLFKNFIDRTNPYTRPPLYKGKPTALLCVGGYSRESVKQLEAIMKEFCRIHILPVKGSVVAVADKKKEILDSPKVLERCRKLGLRMANEARRQKSPMGKQ